MCCATDAEYDLLEHLFQDYSKQAIPTRQSQPVNMTFGLAYVQLVRLVSQPFLYMLFLQLLYGSSSSF